ncbi:MAG: 1-deoxy-D-xylulose-5-phosphate synthase [Bacteroidetes bacterium]|nr:MAG: 1-deoxy-D-xylulose-5-phosphate synthase [Bacteroidota bacterium]
MTISTPPEYALLNRLTSQADLKSLSKEDLPRLAEELRAFILESVASNPGHLGASLGVVELTIALLYTYNPPEDPIVWDVGHQAYGYKILTGRRDAFCTNRQLGGVCGFPHRAESVYDSFGTGHSSTSISAAVGMASAFKLMGSDARTVAVIGDGALTGGIAFEALNNGGASRSDILVILNDNDMSIDPNVGALHQYLLDITTSPSYNRMKDAVWNILGKMGTDRHEMQHRATAVNQAIKGMLMNGSNLFEALGFRYFGPIDGHDIHHLTDVLHDLRGIPGPKLLHCRTKKGKGYAPAEVDQTIWHAPGRFNVQTGERAKEASGQPMKYQDVFGEYLLGLAREDERIVGITAAMPSGTSLSIMMKELPERSFDVGIAEQHAVTFAAGLATEGMIPVVAIYSTFLQRAYDQIIHDVALQNLHVVFCLDRAGVVGDDGATHHGVFDLGYMRPIPNITVCAPANECELRAMMRMAIGGCGPWFIRYPRGRGMDAKGDTPEQAIEIGRGRRLQQGEKVAILTLGTSCGNAEKAIDTLAQEGLKPSHYDFRFLKPFDHELLEEIAGEHSHIITVEDGAVMGGFASAVSDELMGMDLERTPRVVNLGVGDEFVPHGSVAQLQALCGYSPEGIARAVREAYLR